jgi:acyl-CoA thioesterase I
MSRWLWHSQLAATALVLSVSVSTSNISNSFHSIALAAEPSPSLPATCHAPADLVRFTHPLPHTADRLAAREPLTIVAFGSSTTVGVGSSSPEATYPSRLAVDIERLFPGARVTMLNRGVNGEDAGEMLSRFQTSVVAEKPDLVIWQVGTNAVLRDDPLKPADALIRDGILQIKATGADLVLMDPQFAPRVIAKPEIDGMINLMSGEAKRANVDLFARFAIMRGWHDTDGLPFSTFLSPDNLHMNDWGYACVAQLLASSIASVADRAVLSAHAHATSAMH